MTDLQFYGLFTGGVAALGILGHSIYRLSTRGGIRSLKTWRKYVLKRDDYRCDLCGKRSKRNHAHHLYDKDHYPKLKFSISNGLTLCPTHHKGFHRWNGGYKAGCTPEDYARYKKLRSKKNSKSVVLPSIFAIIIIILLWKGLR